MPELVTLAEIRAAQQRLLGVATRTGLHRVSPDRLLAAGVAELPFALYIKAESEQPIGSFKLRGAYNRIAELTPGDLRRGVITYSSGNHAQGVAYAARALGAKAVIVMPNNAPEVKIEATRKLGAEIVLVGPASSERKAKAEELAAAHGYTVIPPYDDPAIIAGQATCGLEILEQLEHIPQSYVAGAKTDTGILRCAQNDNFKIGFESQTESALEQVRQPEQSMRFANLLILSPVSGGGLLSGIATAAKLAWPAGAGTVQVWGAEPELAADAKESFYSKTLVEWPAAKTTRTISDGLRTQSLGVLNFAHILRYADGIVTVREDEILASMRILLAATGLTAEPSGAVTLAAALFHSAELPACDTLVAVLSGGNIEPSLQQMLDASDSNSETPHIGV